MTADLRTACRGIWRAPVLPAIAAVSLAAGIGASVVAFSWLESLVLRPLPAVRDVGSLHLIELTQTDLSGTGSGPQLDAAWREYVDLDRLAGALGAVAAYQTVPLYIGEPGAVDRAYGQLVSASYFDTLGVEPARGRLIEPADVAEPVGSPVVVVSHGFWRSRLDGADDAIGRSIRVNGVPVTVVGVAAAGFHGPLLGIDFSVWLPATAAPLIGPEGREFSRAERAFTVTGRLAPGASVADARRDVDSVMSRLAVEFPETNARVTADVVAYGDATDGPQRFLGQSAAALQAIALMLLAAVCGNVSTLFLARQARRQTESEVRLALGASRARLGRVILAETSIVAGVGALLGVLGASWAAGALWTLPLTDLPLRIDTGVSAWGLGAGALLGAVAAIAGAAAALLHLAAMPASPARASATATRSGRFGRQIMAVQVAMAVIVLIVTAVFVGRFVSASRSEPGFDLDGVLLTGYDLGAARPDAAMSATFAADALERLRAVPGIDGAAIASSVPLDVHGVPSSAVGIGGAPQPGTGERVLVNIVTPGYFDVMGIPLVEGALPPLDDETAAAAVVVNETFVRRHFGEGAAIGRVVWLRGREYVVSGVAADSTYNVFDEPPTPAAYLSYRDVPLPTGQVHVRTSAERELALAGQVRAALLAAQPDAAVFNVRTLAAHVDSHLVFVRIPARMLAVVAPLLVLLAATAIYALASHAVVTRTREIGVRLALGATRSRVTRHLVADSTAPAVVGGVAGWAVGLLGASAIAPGEVGVVGFAVVPAALLAVAAASAWWPASRAVRLDPMTVLRRE